ncbi:sel1 repeat family protein [Grimontia kaedaensis]|uniref:Sel1 repeat family protein n=1 Tax=Grimontia kaedaensis TaxID=2872157 RepID=A0ABY4X1N0_9GAMM|nr:tetratricopeptide repeat protein [Grimontia kaedaensis]USH05154.1 sel1 repeat family protein [Grimontia kaedaensis]
MKKIFMVFWLGSFLIGCKSTSDELTWKVKFENQVQLANNGDPEEINILGVMHAKGLGTVQDDYKAVEYYKKAAGLGHSQAKVNLGYMYENGRGVEKDYSAAIELYREAMLDGNTRAMRNLGWATVMGHGVEKNKEDALLLWEKCAALGDKECSEAHAMFSSGIIP